jgi:hypothetical protein
VAEVVLGLRGKAGKDLRMLVQAAELEGVSWERYSGDLDATTPSRRDLRWGSCSSRQEILFRIALVELSCLPHPVTKRFDPSKLI